MNDELRVIDFGQVSALRSQTLWHAIAYGVSAGAPATLSFMQPTDPYVSVGFHRRLEELDLEFCQRAQLPVFRRMVGGGPVYLDDGQFFFQITIPVGMAPAIRTKAVRWLLQPAVAAFREIGIDAELDEWGEITTGEAKICGHGAGQIEEAVSVVGNLITRFDHAAAARILKSPDRETTDELQHLMHRYVEPTPAQPSEFRRAAIGQYASELGLTPQEGELNADELRQLDELDREFLDPDWSSGPIRPDPDVWRVKIRAGIWMASASTGDMRVTATLQDRTITSVRIVGSGNGAAESIQSRLEGLTLVEASEVSSSDGETGREVSSILDRFERSSY